MSGTQERFLDINTQRKQFKEWAICLAVKNTQEYSQCSLLKYSKAKSIKNKANNFIVYIIGEAPAGFITFRFSKDTAYVLELHVEEKCRSSGIGTKLLDKCKYMHLEVVKRVVLYVYKKNLKAIAFYIKNGFKVNRGHTDEKFHEMVFLNQDG